ncbi:MAG: hypothetical protein NTY64_10825 [Deltaproteobacteria bacterium]|nr:hypothetical protein [Deltaproteobacteria bacterium]
MKRMVGVLSFCILMGMMLSLASGQAVVTGLIVDARDSSFNPTASPKILGVDGREVYGSAYLDKQWVEKHGVVGYSKSMEDAKANPRVGENPHIVKPIKVTGPNNKDLVISDEDARKIRELAKNLNFLDQAKVMIIVP